MLFLHLNDMRSSKIEYQKVVCIGETKEEIEALLERERVPLYEDFVASTNPEFPNGHRFMKSYRKGGPLEWFNKPYNLDKHLRQLETRAEVEAKGDPRLLEEYDRFLLTHHKASQL